MDIFAILTPLIEANVKLAAASRIAAGGGDYGRLLDAARRCRDRIRARPTIWSAAMAFAIDGGIEAARGWLESAAASWDDARLEFERVGMAMYAAAAQFGKGKLTRDGKAIRSAEDTFREQNVAAPDRIADMLLPGIRNAN